MQLFIDHLMRWSYSPPLILPLQTHMVYQFPTPFQEQQRDAILNIILGINEPVWQPTLFSFLFSLKKKKNQNSFFHITKQLSSLFSHKKFKTSFTFISHQSILIFLSKNVKLLISHYQTTFFTFLSQKKLKLFSP
jgi:hypothetical protein